MDKYLFSFFKYVLQASIYLANIFLNIVKFLQ